MYHLSSKFKLLFIVYIKNKGQSLNFVALTHKMRLTMVNKTVAIYVFFDDLVETMFGGKENNQ